MRTQSRGQIIWLLVFLSLVPVLGTAFAVADHQLWHYVVRLPEIGERTVADAPPGSPPVQRLRQSVLNVQVPPCPGGTNGSSGTAFVIAPGYAATAAHVVVDSQSCGAEIGLLDHRGVRHRAILSGFSQDLDLAVLSFTDSDLPALRLADSASLQNPEKLEQIVQVITMGYPPVASASDVAAVSAVGNLSSFREGHFVTSGMELNPGNSGGPVFLTSSWEVMGVAVMKGDAQHGAEGVGIVVPSDVLRRFFRERTGNTL